jgi:hypothetical protein
MIILLLIAAGFIHYLIRMNRHAKQQQSEIDPGKLRKWEDD